jgi:hypothetical protein
MLTNTSEELPHNVLVIDTSAFERSLFSAGHRGTMVDAKTNKPRTPGSTLALETLLRSLAISTIPCQLHNSGNDAFMCLFALQKLLDPDNTQLPTPKVRIGRPGAGLGVVTANTAVKPPNIVMPMMTAFQGYGQGASSPVPMTPGGGYLDTGEFGQVRRSPSLQPYLSASMGSTQPRSTIEKGLEVERNALSASMRTMARR